MYFPDKKRFKQKAKQGNLIPVYREIVADIDTPVSAFLKLKKSKYSFLLESVEGGERYARYSFLGTNPSLIFKSKKEKIEILKEYGNKIEVKEKIENKNPIFELKKILSKYKPVNITSLPRFCGGAVGYLSYDVVRFFEKLPDRTIDDLNLPDCYFILTDTLLIFDHLKHKILVMCCAFIEDDVDKSYGDAVKKIDDIILQLKKPSIFKNRKINISEDSIASNFTKEEFISAVKKAKKYIYSGDIIQVVLSQRFSKKINCDPFDIYRVLRTINPSPYLFYLNLDNIHLVGSSPEMLVRLEGSFIQTKPIAGTRPRGKNEKEDEKFKTSLLSSVKEKAEHIMLVDLARNDVGRVAKYGSVKLSEFMNIEKYSHVMHIVSEVIGRIKNNYSAYELISTTLPAGTVSGAPKVRAMEIIEELEPTKRGVYAGAIGYFSFSGNTDTAIAIRTIVIKDNIAYIQAGAGIVADSNPQREYIETINKAKVLFKAINDINRNFSLKISVK